MQYSGAVSLDRQPTTLRSGHLVVFQDESFFLSERKTNLMSLKLKKQNVYENTETFFIAKKC